MFFKGSTNTTQSQLEKKVEQMGCRLNAYTSREQVQSLVCGWCALKSLPSPPPRPLPPHSLAHTNWLL